MALATITERSRGIVPDHLATGPRVAAYDGLKQLFGAARTEWQFSVKHSNSMTPSA